MKYINMLGLKVTDRVTGFTGIVSSVCFDLYGCVQLTVNPGLDKDGKQKDSLWYDYNRLKIICKKPVMDQPEFDITGGFFVVSRLQLG
jgi:hypothetical protein